MTRVVGLMMVLLCWWTVSGAEAACSGSGQSWSCTAGTTPNEINTALSSASDGATLTFDGGSYTWGGGTMIQPSLSKGVTLMCASMGACNVTYGNRVWELPPGSSSRLYRFSGFNFTTSSSAIWWWQCSGGSCAKSSYSNVRIDHNVFSVPGNNPFLQTDNASVIYIYGVIDHNTFNVTSMTANLIIYNGSVDSAPTTGNMASANNLFVEDNVFNVATWVDGGVGCVDGWGNGTNVVWRFNSMTNCRTLMHGVPHNWGPSNFELYGNSYTFNSRAALPTGYRAIHHQGSGTFATWGNSFATSSHEPSTIAVLHYRAFQPGLIGICDGTNAQDGNRAPQSAYQGYPCKHQPGRDNNGLLYPMFGFLNRWTDDGAKVDLVINGSGATLDYTAMHLRQNRDIYNAVSASAQTSSTSPFNGTTGMGYGTLANRPTTCTTTTENLDAGRGGVLYWATDQGNWNTSASNPQGVQQNGSDGVLYICSAPNTWSVYYTPYTYPHPLQSGQAPPAGGGGSGSGVPQAPSNLRLIPSQL